MPDTFPIGSQLARYNHELTWQVRQAMGFRQWKFWQEWVCHKSPHEMLIALKATGDIAQIPELAALIGIPQDPEWHPEGDVWTHTILVCEQAAKICARDQVDNNDRYVLMLSALCHDLGKAVATEYDQGRWRSPKHAEKGYKIADEFLSSISCPQMIIDQVLPLIREHLVYSSAGNINPRVIKRLLHRLQPANFGQLERLIEADHGGRPPLVAIIPEKVREMRRILNQLNFDQPSPLITGKHLIEKGLQPGPAFNKILASSAESMGVFRFG